MPPTPFRLFVLLLTLAAARAPAQEWPYVGGDAGGARFAELDQINKSNVAQLRPAWTYDTGDERNGKAPTIECTPIVAEGTLYLTTGRRVVAALDPATGAERWRFDPNALPHPHPQASGGVNRGCAFWSDGAEGGERRVLHGTTDGRLFAIDARTGRLDPGFGEAGVVDLRAGLAPEERGRGYGVTSAPAVWRDTVILGFTCGEGPGLSAPGDVRAFDVRTGRERWRFHTVPRDGELGADTWEGDSRQHRGAANAWSGLTIDQQRGWVFAGLGSAAFDFYGGERPGQNLFANCTIAIDIRTGERVWHFQTVHHDLSDHDLPTPPNLVDIAAGGERLQLAVQVTKTGYCYVFDRETGEPRFDIVERPAPESDVPGEQAWPTQPIPTKPPALVPQTFDENTVTDIGEANRAGVLERLAGLRHGAAFTPPSLRGSVILPGFHGGANWSGACCDPTTGLLYVNVTNCANVMQLLPAEDGPDRYGPYNHKGYGQFLDHEGYPAGKPPWGELIAVDVVRGEIAWRAVLGEHVELTARGIPPTGTQNFGGPIVTAGGLVFIAGTKDERLRAFDKQTGEVLWEHQLPAGGYATPATYSAGGKQYVVIAAGGAGKLRTRGGDQFVAFALPD